MQLGAGGRRKQRRRGQPVMPKRRETVESHPFRKTTSGFESLLPRKGAEDFFFSKLFVDPEHAAEFFEHGEDRDPILGDPRAGVAVSAVFHILLVLFLLFDPKLFNLLSPTVEPEDQVLETQKDEPLVFFMDEPASPPEIAAVPLVPVVPVAPEGEAAPPPPEPKNNALVIPKAMLAPDKPSEAQDDLPFSRGNTEEFYTSEEVKKPGEEGSPVETPEQPDAETLVAEESGEDALDVDAVVGAEDGTDKVADNRMSSKELGDLLLRDSMVNSNDQARQREQQRRRIEPPEPQVMRSDVGQGGENGKFTDIRRFLAGAQFDHPTGGLVVAGRDNTLYYNDRGANFVPWIAHMLAEVRRTWIASMPYAANVYAGHTAVRFVVARNGTVTAMETVVRSGVPGFDNNAEGAIRGARLSPLPADYPDDTFEIIIVFWVNERPYDIFG